jgi:hypothetical protein
MKQTGLVESERPRLTQLFAKIRDEAANHDYEIGQLLDIFNRRGYGLVLLFLIVPSLTPIPIPGLGSAFGVLVAIQGLAMIFAVTPRLPKRIARLRIKSQTTILICNGCCHLFKIVEKFIRPRLTVFSRQPFSFINGLLIFVGGCVLSLPLILPFSNFVPAFLVLLICLGTIEDDGLMILIGYLYFISFIILFALFGPRLIEFLRNIFTYH